MRAALFVGLVAVLGAGCADDKDDAVAPGIRDLCAAQCDRADDCGFLEGAKPGECESSCESVQTKLSEGECTFTDGELDACADAFSAQECSEIQSAVIPEACTKTCRR